MNEDEQFNRFAGCMCLLKALLPNDVSFMEGKEMMDAFKIFKEEINTSKIEFKIA